MSTIPSARLVPFKDLDKCKIGDSIRITGIWEKYDDNTKVAVIKYGEYKAEVDTTESQESIPAKGDSVQCIGEVTEEATFGILRIHARIIRILNTIDLALYEKVVELRNSII